MKILVLGESSPGLSITLMGEHMCAYFESKGHDVAFADVGRTDRPDLSTKGLSKMGGRHIVSLSEWKIPSIRGMVRYQRPLSVQSIYCGNFEDKDETDTTYFLSQFVKPPVPTYHVCHSYHSHAKTVQHARKVFTPSIVQLIAQHTKVFPFGIEEGFAPGKNDPDKMIAPFNRKASQKKIDLHMEVLQKYQAKYGGQCKLWHAPNWGFDEDHPVVTSGVYDVEPQYADRAQFKQAVSEYGLFLCTSQFESFGIYYLELLAAGVVGVFLDRPWINDLLPNYPFIASAADLPATLMAVREDYEASRKLVQEYLASVMEMYRVERFYEDLLGVMGEHEE